MKKTQWVKLPQIDPKKLYIGCLNCSSACLQAPMNMDIAVGFGGSYLIKDGKMVLDGDFEYTSIRVKCCGGPVTTPDIQRTANYRGVPFVRAGMKVIVDGCSGVIVSHNSSANWDVLFDDDSKWAGQVLNCHPCWEIAYFDDDGTMIRDFRKKVNTGSL